MTVSYRLQAEAVDVTAAEYRDHLASRTPEHVKCGAYMLVTMRRRR